MLPCTGPVSLSASAARPAGVLGRVLRPAVSRQAHQPGRSAVEVQDTLSGLPPPEHGYSLLSGANEVDQPTGREPGDELG